MRLTGAEALVRALVEEGTGRVFGIPSAQTIDLHEALAAAGVEVVLSTSEAAAAYGADGAARVTGRPGVLVVAPGPGLLAALTGLAQASADNVPLVAIAGGVRRASDRAYQVREADQLAAARPLVKEVVALRTVEEIPAAVAGAFRAAGADRPGPVVVELPCDLAAATGTVGPCPRRPHEPRRPDPSEVEAMADLVRGARRVGLYVGQGVFGAEDHLLGLAERLGAPVATTISGRGALPEDHRLAVGHGFGPGGHPAGPEVFAACDLVLALGCRFAEVATGGWSMARPPRIVHVDADPAVGGRNVDVDLFVVADAGRTLEALLAALGDHRIEEDPAIVEAIARARRDGQAALSSGVLQESQVRPDRFFAALRRVLDRRAIVVTDSGNHLLWAVGHLPVLAPRTFLAPVDFQASGYGVGAAIGAALAAPDRQVVAVVGDGSLLQAGHEILTAVRHRLPVAFFVLADGNLGLVGQVQEAVSGRRTSIHLTSPDLKGLAGALKVSYRRLAGDDELEARLGELLPVRGPTLVHVPVRYDEPSPHLAVAIAGHLAGRGAGAPDRSVGAILRSITRRIFPPPPGPR